MRLSCHISCSASSAIFWPEVRSNAAFFEKSDVFRAFGALVAQTSARPCRPGAQRTVPILHRFAMPLYVPRALAPLAAALLRGGEHRARVGVRTLG